MGVTSRMTAYLAFYEVTSDTSLVLLSAFHSFLYLTPWAARPAPRRCMCSSFTLPWQRRWKWHRLWARYPDYSHGTPPPRQSLHCCPPPSTLTSRILFGFIFISFGIYLPAKQFTHWKWTSLQFLLFSIISYLYTGGVSPAPWAWKPGSTPVRLCAKDASPNFHVGTLTGLWSSWELFFLYPSVIFSLLCDILKFRLLGRWPVDVSWYYGDTLYQRWFPLHITEKSSASYRTEVISELFISFKG